MQYNQPLNETDPDASYVDGNPGLGIEGSIIPAAAVEDPQREIVNMLLKNQLTPSPGDKTQLARAQQADIVNFAVDTGAASTVRAPAESVAVLETRSAETAEAMS